MFSINSDRPPLILWLVSTRHARWVQINRYMYRNSFYQISFLFSNSTINKHEPNQTIIRYRRQKKRRGEEEARKVFFFEFSIDYCENPFYDNFYFRIFTQKMRKSIPAVFLKGILSYGHFLGMSFSVLIKIYSFLLPR